MRRLPWRQTVIVGVLALTAAWLGLQIWELGGKASIAIREAKETEAHYLELEERKTTLESDLSLLATPRGQDEAIREAFGVARSGEEVIVVVPPPAATSTPERPWWERFFSWF